MLAEGIHHGDCRALLKQVEPGSATLVFADPPYHLSNGGFTVASGKQVPVDKGSWDKSLGLEEDFKFHLDWLTGVKQALSPNGSVFVSGTYHSIYRCGFALEKLGFRILNNITWLKPNGAPNLSGRTFTASSEVIIWASKSKSSKHTFNYLDMKNGDFPEDSLKRASRQMRDVWSIPTPGPKEKTFGAHPTQKPLKLLERIVLAASNPGDLVLDPFSGTGTTGIAAKRHGRRFLGMELDQTYFEISLSRLNGEND